MSDRELLETIDADGGYVFAGEEHDALIDLDECLPGLVVAVERIDDFVTAHLSDRGRDYLRSLIEAGTP